MKNVSEIFGFNFEIVTVAKQILEDFAIISQDFTSEQ